MNIYWALPEKNRIELGGDPQKYPQLYAKDYTFDIGHLNASGSHIYSEILALSFAELLKQSKKYAR